MDPRSKPPWGRIFEDLREAEALLVPEVRRDLFLVTEELLLGTRCRRERDKNDNELGVGG